MYAYEHVFCVCVCVVHAFSQVGTLILLDSMDMHISIQMWSTRMWGHLRPSASARWFVSRNEVRTPFL